MKISFSEQILLLMLDDETGKIYPEPGQYLDYALAGSLLLELVMEGVIRLHHGYVKIIYDAALVDVIGSKVMEFLLMPELDLKLENLLPEFLNKISQFVPLILNQLVEKNILEPDNYQYRWRRSNHLNLDKNLLLAINVKQILRDVVFNNKIPSEHEAIFMGIANITGLLSHVFRPEDVKVAYSKIVRLVKLEVINHVLAGSFYEFEKTTKILIQEWQQ